MFSSSNIAASPLPQWHTILVAVFLIVFLTINFLSLRHLSPTTDEEKHYLYGTNILALDSDRFDDSKMPFSALNALPRKIGELLPDGRFRILFQEFHTARLVTILFSAGVALLVYRWARELYGNTAGLLALFLYTFDPNIIAHSMLVTTDLYAVGMILLALYSFWKFLHHPTWKSGLFAAFVLGMGQLAKYTSVFLYPLFLLMVFVFFFQVWFPALREKDFSALRRYLTKTILYALMFLGVSLVMINFGFLFNRVLFPLGAYTFESELFQNLQETLPENLPVPVPYPYLEGLDLVSYRERSGFGFGRMYLFGELRERGGFPGYYFYVTLLKMPIATQITIIVALILYIRTFNLKQFLQNDQFLLLPTLFFTLYFNFFYGAQIGIRFFIIIFPLLYILCGRLGQVWERLVPKEKKVGGAMAAGLALYLIGSVLSFHPHYIPYTNEFILDRRFAYRYIADSNLDWEQADFYLEDYLAVHPNARVNPLRPRDGLTIVSVNALVGVIGEREGFAWLRDNFEPVDTIAYAFLVYDISTTEFKEAFP